MRVFIGFLIWLTLLSTAEFTMAQSVSLSRCISFRERIDEYSDLRRRGGSASEVERWKQARNDLEEKFGKHNCKAYGKPVG